MTSIAQAIYREAEQLPDEALRDLLAHAIRLLAARGAATAEQLRILDWLTGDDRPTGAENMAVQLSFDGRHNREVDQLTVLLGRVHKEVVNGTLWFSGVEFASAVRGSNVAPRQYWYKTKQRIEQEDGETLQSSPHSLQLKIEAADGKKYATDMLDEQGCYRVLMAIPGKQAGRIRAWMAQQIQEYREVKAGTDVRAPITPDDHIPSPDLLAIEQLLELNKLTVGYLRRMEIDNARRDRDIAEIKETLRGKQEEAAAPLLPATTVDAPVKTTRAAVVQLVRSAAHRRGTPHSFLFSALYREFRDRTHHDVAQIAKNRDVQVLDIVEELELMEELYSIAHEMYGED